MTDPNSGIVKEHSMWGDMKKKPTKHDMKHVLFKTGNRNAPDCVKDRNGEVVLGLCQICGAAEIELSQPCAANRARRTNHSCK